MENKIYEKNYSVKEFTNLFKRKRCKLCGGKLIKQKHYEDAGYGKVKIVFTTKGKIVKVSYRYKCEKCNAEYDLKEYDHALTGDFASS